MGFLGARGIAEAHEAGRFKYSSWRKVPSQATSANQWFDLSMSPGNPLPNYYASAPLVAATLNGGEGIFHGGPVAPRTKHLAGFTALSAAAGAVAATYVLADYLLYYPFVDMGSSDEQPMDNAVALPRYADGRGVRLMAVVVAPPAGSVATFSVRYVNQDGVPGCVTPIVRCNAGTTNGTIANGAVETINGGPFIPLQAGDTGVRAVESVTFFGLDVGLLAFVLVAPLATVGLTEITAPREVCFVSGAPSLPRIHDGAYLNLIACPSASMAAAQIIGDATFIWE